MRFPDWYERLAKSDESLAVTPASVYSLVYPPVGFWPLLQQDNGDELGFYWPLGREDAEPLVVQTEHVWGLIPLAGTLIDLWTERTVMIERDGSDPDEDP